MIYQDKVSQAFIEKVVSISEKLKIQPDWLMKVMYKETGGTFSPSIRNPKSTATGLIQFLEGTAKKLGTSTAKLAKMNAIEQLTYVYKYLSNFAGKMRSYADVYLAVFYPSALYWDDGKKFPQSIYSANKGIDTMKRGYITVSDFKSWANGAKPPIAQKRNTTTGIFLLLAAAGIVYIATR